MRIPGVYWFIMKYISPLYLLTIFGLWCYYKLPTYIDDVQHKSPDDQGTVWFVLAFIVAILLFFNMLVYLAGRRWRFDPDRPVEEGPP